MILELHERDTEVLEQILDHGIVSVGLNLSHHPYKPDQGRVLAMAGCHQLCPGADTAFQLSQIFDAQRRFLFVLLIQSSILLSGLRQ